MTTQTAAAPEGAPWWPVPAAGRDALLDRDRPAGPRGEGWWAPAATTAAIALTPLFGCRLPARFRSGPARVLPLATPGGTVRTRALAEAVTVRAEAVPGVARSRARVLPRSRRRLEVRLRVRLRPGTPPEAVPTSPCAVTAGAERSAAPYTARTRLRLSAASAPPPRVR